MSPDRPEWSTDPMSPSGAGSHLDLQVDQQKIQEVDSRLSQVPKPHPPPPPGVTDSPYPYYTPREGEVVWPPTSMDPPQHPYMGPGPSRIPYDPGAFTYGDEGQSSSSTRPPQQQQQSSSQYPPTDPPPLDRAFDSGNYHGMTSPSTDPSTNILTPAYQFSNQSQQHFRSTDQYPFSNNGSSNQPQIPRNQLSQSQSGYQYPSDTRALLQEAGTSRRQSKRLNEGTGEWSGPEYNQLGVQPGPSYRPFMPPNLDPTFYQPFPGQARMSPERHQDPNSSASPRRSASTNSPQDAGGRGSGRRKSGTEIVDDEEDWSHLPESERALAKLDKRRGQNKIAQRAFRARTRMNKAQTSTDLAHLTDLTQAQAKRLDDMTILVATLQRENAELRMAAMSGQQPPPPTNSLPISEIKDRPVPPNDPTTRPNQVEDKGSDPDQQSSSRNKRPARSRSSS